MAYKLKLRKVYFLILSFCWLAFSSQTAPKGGNNSFKDLTKLPANYASWKNSVIPLQNLVSTLKHDTCINKKFSIVFYLIQDSTYNFNVPGAVNNFVTNNITPFINTLNAQFKRICVSFQNCSTVVIPNHPYNNWAQFVIDPVVTSNWYTTKTINFYLPTGLNGGGGLNNVGGYTYMPNTPGTNKDVIVMQRAQLTNTVLAMHIFGHFFGLPNTQDEINPVPPAVPGPPPGVISHEYANQMNYNPGNCYVHGDGFCDTEADPYPVGFNPNIPPTPPCHFDTGPADGLGKYYTPPLDNYMSEYVLQCRCRFTQEQWNFMARVMITSKFYLH